LKALGAISEIATETVVSKALGVLATVGGKLRRALVRFAHEEAAQRHILVRYRSLG